MKRGTLTNVNPPMLMILMLGIQQINERLFSVLRLTTVGGAARSVLLQLEPKPGRPGD